MASLREVRREARRLGARVVGGVQYGRVNLEVEAPTGYRWAWDDMTTVLVAEQWPDETRADVYEDLLNRMTMGVVRL
jgi:hypothetical protein